MKTSGLILAAGTLTVLGQAARGRGIQARPIIATGLLGIAFAGLEGINADAAKYLATALVITAALTSGADAIGGLNRILDNAKGTE